ncbi:cobalt-precorrin-6A reductase [Roseofilum reptotaenium CS-1145]|uniref:Cobalt-precorrin-6A reductase n=1 Tax=Roseofilum reptotaenium AO1-A TaxID=1925591 RepID=A0A1L9QKC9_9CYAN|nr:cobalt-precorrin-6A reductase [Roseofilum reptotaenium]MDB9516790.1 cobalt-precorrin-6A reductase [Roseofilum reptotaenium CS-1145]OJJ15952.1 cobalt-precorrin-6A reductase [Roseofilum reptotaenium AO1-A]
MTTVWLIGGTSESRLLAQGLVKRGVECVVTVTTEPARSLYATYPGLTVWVGKLKGSSLDEFTRSHDISVILDTSHPWAVKISQLAIAFSECSQIPYLRYERPPVTDDSGSSQIVTLDSFATLVSGDYLTDQRVFLTVGYQRLPLFQPWQHQATLFARVLPSAKSIQIAQEAGFTSDRLIAIRPPIPEALELALWQHWQISLVVTKASGNAGGEAIKRQLCDRLGIPLITITRPKMSYPQQTEDIEEAIEFCLSHVI